MDALPVARPDLAEGLATEKVAIYGGATHCPIYIVHLSSPTPSRRSAAPRGAEIYVETRPVYLFLTKGATACPASEARKYAAWPPAAEGERPRGAVARAYERRDRDVRDRPHHLDARAKDRPVAHFSSVPGGVSNVERLLGMLYSDGVRPEAQPEPLRLGDLRPPRRSSSDCGRARERSRSARTPTSPSSTRSAAMRIEASGCSPAGTSTVQGPRGRRLAGSDDRPPPRRRRRR